MTDVAPIEAAPIPEDAAMMMLAKTWEEGRQQGRLDAVYGLTLDFEAMHKPREGKAARAWLKGQLEEMKQIVTQAIGFTIPYAKNPYQGE